MAKYGSFGIAAERLEHHHLRTGRGFSSDQLAKREKDSSGRRQPRQRIWPSTQSGAFSTGPDRRR
jgi:hypothetical protein